MIRIVLYLAFIILAAIGIAEIASTPGSVEIVWRDYKIETSAAFLLLSFGLSAALLALLYVSIRFLAHAPKRLRRRRQFIRYARGLQAATQAMASLSASEKDRAKTYTKRTRKYLQDAAITHLLEAQLAKLEQDEPRTRKALEQMLKHSETRALAARSLAEYNVRQGNLIEAQKLAWQAKDSEPNNPNTYRTLFQISLQSRQWQQAQQAIEKAVWARAISRYTAKRWRALLAYTRAQAFSKANDLAAALYEAEHAFAQLPSHPQIAVFFANLLGRQHQFAQSSSVLKRAWKLGPHPLLTDTLIGMAAERPAAATLRLAKKLAAMKPSHPESAVLLARAYMQASHVKEAREVLKRAVEKTPTARIYDAFADLEEQSFQDKESAVHWRMKAAQHTDEERWACNECGHATLEWALFCPACSSMDGLEWKKPPATFQHQLI